ncbi:hypothetical protein [uncultured Aquimarina sp.]|uniref:hypothetical protein n=1 Tax=uncultured Aquimarina sp. TaxID=575652 RepID=UPI002601CE35|nr:hypothetical protein [uncultured Aquimarina sp.]
MKKINIFLLVLMISTFNLIAQDPKLSENFTVEVGEEYGETDGGMRNFYKYDGYIVGINRHKDHLIIQKFDPNTLKEVERKEHKKFFKEKRREDFEKILRLGDNVLFFYAQWDRKAKVESLEYEAISLKTLEISEFKEIIRQEGKVAGDFAFVRSGFFTTKAKTLNKYEYRTSYDEDQLLLEYRLKPKFRDDSKSYDRISINVFDKDLNVIWNNVVEMPYTEKKMDNEDFAIDKEGNFFMLAKVYEDDTTNETKKRKRSKKGKKDANYHLEIFKVKKGTNTIVNSKIEIGDKLVDEILLYENALGDIVLSGTSKNPDSGKGLLFGKRRGQATGIFTAKLDNEGAISDFNSYDFPIEMLTKYATKKEKKKNKKKENDEAESPAFNGLKINTIAANDDGSFVILGEQRYIVANTRTTSTGRTSTSYVHYYRDILAAKINVDGTLAWMHKLPKLQVGRRGKRTMSYTHMFAGENHYLLYLDNVKNLNLPEDKVPYKHTDGKGGYFTAYIINDQTGEVKKEAIFNTRDFNGTELEHFETDKIFALSDSEILIEGFEGRSKDFLVKVKAK